LDPPGRIMFLQLSFEKHQSPGDSGRPISIQPAQRLYPIRSWLNTIRNAALMCHVSHLDNLTAPGQSTLGDNPSNPRLENFTIGKNP
jgi:hypothetical protein